MDGQNKPLIVEMEEAKQELAQCVNDILQKHGLNCYLIEPTVAELYSQIKITAQRELSQAMMQIKATETVSEGGEV